MPEKSVRHACMRASSGPAYPCRHLIGMQVHGGTNCVKNLQPLCGSKTPSKCNQAKGNKYPMADKVANKASPTVRRKGAVLVDAMRNLKL